jgi:hypothetical protein
MYFYAYRKGGEYWLQNVCHMSFLYFPHEFYILWTCFQIANHLDRAVVSLGREPLKVMVQVNTSGEECEYKEDIKLI